VLCRAHAPGSKAQLRPSHIDELQSNRQYRHSSGGLSGPGVSWDKLQWLVAALSVGLASVLQEIFANFGFGPVILFGKSRFAIGDVVPFGALSGTVEPHS